MPANIPFYTCCGMGNTRPYRAQPQPQPCSQTIKRIFHTQSAVSFNHSSHFPQNTFGLYGAFYLCLIISYQIDSFLLHQKDPMKNQNPLSSSVQHHIPPAHLIFFSTGYNNPILLGANKWIHTVTHRTDLYAFAFKKKLLWIFFMISILFYCTFQP